MDVAAEDAKGVEGGGVEGSAGMHMHGEHEMHDADGAFPTATEGLAEATPPVQLELAGGEMLDLRVAPVVKRLGEATVRMLSYNGSVPGPTVRVRQGSEIVVQVTNQGDMDTTVHWHGLRLENRYDGVPHETQLPIPVGGTFTYRLRFPDPGLYWYHPHIREDYGQELGLYGNIVVDPTEPDYWPPVNREVVVTLDDLLLEGGQIAPFSPSETNYAAMGRFGNVLLVGGEPDLSLTAMAGEAVRLYLTNTANTRVFNVRLPGARMKLVGGDSGRYEREEFVDSVLLAPSERAVVDVLFYEPGQLTLEHRTPQRTYSLATVTVSEEQATPSLATGFAVLRAAPELVAERRRLDWYLAAPPDKTLALVAEMDDPAGLTAGVGPVVYACPMHPEVTSDEPGRCPKCGMKLLATHAVTQPAGSGAPEMRHESGAEGPHGEHAHGEHEHAHGEHEHAHAEHEHAHAEHEYAHGGHTQREHEHAHGEHEHREHGDGHEHSTDDSHGHHGHGAGDGIEWEDDMVEVNRLTTTATMHWMFVDRTAGAVSGPIDWRFKVGDRVKIRLVNEMDSDHPMHHPFHLHGAGRFLVLTRDGVVEPNLVWKDTVLVRTGETVDILFDVSNPGLWMAHCHIAEHMQSGMMFSFTVARDPAETR
jgi:FtsP/CotA-like multicopper oxidase with cupredoxin domain